MSIRTKISIIYSLLLALLIALSGGIYLHYFIRTSKDRVVKNIKNYAQIATPSIIHSYEFYKNTSFLQIYREIYPILENNPYLNYIEIISPDGRILFNSNDARMGLYQHREADKRYFPYIKKLHSETVLDENYIIHVFIPFIDEFGSHIYTVHYVNSVKSTFEHFRETTMGIIIVTILTILLSVLISTFVAKGITAKINHLKYAAINFEKGNLDANFNIHSDDEIGELAEVFEQMRKTIKSNITTLQDTVRKQQELDRLKNEFIANISHELKTPLTAAIGYISLINRRKIGQPSDEVIGALKIVEKNLHELSLKIDSILQLTKLQMYRNQIEISKIDLAKIIQKCIEAYRPVANMKGIEIVADIEDNNSIIEGDKIGLRSMICNLIDNAVKFTERGRVRVHLKIGENKKYVVIEVEDTGIGIPQDKLKKIYERFYQVESSNIRRYGGIGLGLSIVKEVVELHNGIIKVKSSEGKGTLFRILLPTRRDEDGKENTSN